MISFLLDWVFCFFARSEWLNFGGVSSSNSVVSMLVERSKEAECSSFLFDVAEASRMSVVGNCLLKDD
ncbi:hypothetical protein V6N13_124357 [Hibiscus sabdariffa]